MKANVLKFTAILLFLAVGLTSCSDKTKSYDNPHITIFREMGTSGNTSCTRPFAPYSSV